jgi:dihydroflavonol-4-reductase
VIGPEDYTRSEFGELCWLFWRGKIPLIFGGGHNFVDVRDVAVGHLLAAERGRPGRRYLLGGENRSWTSFFSDLTRAAGKSIPRMRVPALLGGVLSALHARLPYRRGQPPRLTAAQQRLLGLYFFVSSDRARRELDYQPRPLPVTVRDSHEFWMNRRAA